MYPSFRGGRQLSLAFGTVMVAISIHERTSRLKPQFTGTKPRYCQFVRQLASAAHPRLHAADVEETGD